MISVAHGIKDHTVPAELVVAFCAASALSNADFGNTNPPLLLLLLLDEDDEATAAAEDDPDDDDDCESDRGRADWDTNWGAGFWES